MRKLGYILIGGALIIGLQWAVPAAYSAVASEEKAAESCPMKSTCPMKGKAVEAEV